MLSGVVGAVLSLGPSQARCTAQPASLPGHQEGPQRGDSWGQSGSYTVLTWGPPTVAGGLAVLETTSASARRTCNAALPDTTDVDTMCIAPQVKTVKVLTVPKEEPRKG